MTNGHDTPSQHQKTRGDLDQLLPHVSVIGAKKRQ